MSAIMWLFWRVVMAAIPYPRMKRAYVWACCQAYPWEERIEGRL